MTSEDKKKYCIKECPRCKGEGKVMMKIKRSMNQNRYYWSVIVLMIATEIGEDKDTTHEILRYKFNSEKKVLADQSVIQLPLSTSELDTIKFEEYLSTIRRWAFEYLNLNIPLPDKVDERIIFNLEEMYEQMFRSINK